MISSLLPVKKELRKSVKNEWESPVDKKRHKRGLKALKRTRLREKDYQDLTYLYNTAHRTGKGSDGTKLQATIDQRLSKEKTANVKSKTAADRAPGKGPQKWETDPTPALEPMTWLARFRKKLREHSSRKKAERQLELAKYRVHK